MRGIGAGCTGNAEAPIVDQGSLFLTDAGAIPEVFVATGDDAESPVEERPFEGRVAPPQREPAFRPRVPS